jgi:hypothetical protein
MRPRLFAARTPLEKTALERQIAATDAQIDHLVDDLYGLTEKEIKIVEGTNAGFRFRGTKPSNTRRNPGLDEKRLPTHLTFRRVGSAMDNGIEQDVSGGRRVWRF